MTRSVLTSRKNRPRPILIAASALFLGIITGTYSWYEASRAQAALTWPSVGGTVLACDASKSGLRSRGYTADVLYQYAVGGVQYTSRRVQLQSDSDGRVYTQVLAQVRSQFPVGGTVNVFYDPSDPSSAILRQQAGDFARGWRILVMASVAGGVLAVFDWFKNRS